MVELGFRVLGFQTARTEQCATCRTLILNRIYGFDSHLVKERGIVGSLARRIVGFDIEL